MISAFFSMMNEYINGEKMITRGGNHENVHFNNPPPPQNIARNISNYFGEFGVSSANTFNMEESEISLLYILMFLS